MEIIFLEKNIDNNFVFKNFVKKSKNNFEIRVIFLQKIENKKKSIINFRSIILIYKTSYIKKI